MVVIDELLAPLGRPQWRWQQSLIIVAFSLVIWAAVGLGPYSGEGAPPMYGDFEAQRHWMEITNHLPTAQWYYYDLEWWGLDYPPLTAYHSWLIGRIGRVLGLSDEFSLDASRGAESPDLKSFMRHSAVFSQALVYLPAVWLWYRRHPRNIAALAAVLLQPCLVVIDHGHFQYNAVMLGFFVLALVELDRGRDGWASFWFVLALMFKQMALYYAPVIFFVILSRCLPSFAQPDWIRLLKVGSVVIVTSLLLLSPFARHLDQVAFRVFPFARGLWEDKVANVWCAANTVVKLKQLFEPQDLQRLALAATLVGIIPSCIAAFKYPSRSAAWPFAHCAWSFFLFSFQVHEKSVLLPLVPTTLAGLFSGDVNSVAMTLWINNIAYFSLWPLLKREKLGLQYVVLGLLWNWLLSTWRRWPTSYINRFVVAASYAVCGTLWAAELSGLIPQAILDRLPDLWTVANVLVACGCFGYFWLWLGVHLFRSKRISTDETKAKKE